MFINLKNRKGQNTLEYAVVIAVIVAALIAMQGYLKRGVQGKLRQSSDDIGEQFSPNATTGQVFETGSVTSDESYSAGIGSTTTTYNNRKTDTQNFNTGTYADDYWK